MWLNKTVLHSYSLSAPQNWRSKEQSFLLKITHFTHWSTDRKTVVERRLLLDLQGQNPQTRVRSHYHWIFWTNHRVLGENLLPFCRWKLDRPSRTKKPRHLPSKPMKKRNSRWRMMLWTSMAVIGWFACKSLSDWVRYLVIVMCTGKSGIFRGQPVSLRGSNPDYSGRSASRVKNPQWGAADAEIKVPSGENTELKLSPFKAWSRSVYSHTCYAYCQGFLSFLLISTLPVHSPAFFPKPLPIFPCVGCG